MSEPLLLRHTHYLHPAYGELAFIRAYSYGGRRYKFRTSNGAYEITLQRADVELLTCTTP